jgi:hypothetical protein
MWQPLTDMYQTICCDFAFQWPIILDTNLTPSEVLLVLLVGYYQIGFGRNLTFVLRIPKSTKMSWYCFFNSRSTSSAWGHATAQWLRHCATNRKVARSIPNGITGIFHWHNPFGRTMNLGSTQTPTEMSTRNIYGGKDGRCLGLTTLPPSCADCLKIWEPQPAGTLRACQGV